MSGHGEKLSRRQEAAIAALLTEPTHAAAAAKVGIGEATLRRLLRLPNFGAAYRAARRELVEAAVGRIQAATGQAVDTLLAVARGGAKESDRVRAAAALLDHAYRGLTDAEARHGKRDAGDAAPVRDTAGVVQLLAVRLQQLDAAELPTSEKARLTVTLADALLRPIGVDVLGKRLEALQAVLLARKNGDK
jgi:hypothetical protein